VVDLVKEREGCGLKRFDEGSDGLCTRCLVFLVFWYGYIMREKNVVLWYVFVRAENAFVAWSLYA
jgi:hypothetical protein